MEADSMASPSGKTSKSNNFTIIPKAKVNDATFKILITGSEDVAPELAREIKEYIVTVKKLEKLKIHHAVVVNEEIAKRHSTTGVHAVVLSLNASKSVTLPNLQETMKHLDFELLSTSLFIMNESQPLAQLFPTIVDAIEKLALTYNIRPINFIASDPKSIKFAASRVSNVALRSAGFIFGHNTPIFRNIDFSQLQEI